MNEDKITKQHVLNAVEKIERENIWLVPSVKYDVIINGKAYPPKEIMRYANLEANGTKNWFYGGGEATNQFLKGWGFEVIEKGMIFSSQPSKNEIPLTGKVWKLGCWWGRGAPSFYKFIKDRQEVICTSDKRYGIGDLVILAEGHNVLALAKVIENPRPVTDIDELEDPYDVHKIDYEDWVEIAKAEWYELKDDERFEYPTTTGRHGADDPYRSMAISIWNDRFINYWIFQCNPNDFDFEKSVRNKLLRQWTVVAHKEKIKIGDKVILWLTGKKAGCYALARITSEPSVSTVSTDDHLWKTEPKNALKAGIELTHNLIGNPVLWQSIKSTEGLANLNVGNQGTNFSATRKQYNTLLKLIEKSTQNMSTNIDIFLNTILYGPPGTGKTFKLNEYKDEYFTDKGVRRSSEEVLKEKVSAYPFWKVLGAVLGSFDDPVSVTEILENSLVKAKINPEAKTPRNTIWRILQSYADEVSTEMDAKYKGPLQLFQKNKESQWSLIPGKRHELIDIIDQELLDIAANPELQPVQSAAFKRRYNFITFHQKYSYEDFIEGIKPLLKEEEVDVQIGELQFQLKKGIFYNSCLEALRLVGYKSFKDCYNDSIENRIEKFQTASGKSSMQYALFIDEINRANISAVFGELITLLEEDKRIGAANEMWIELPYSNEKFCVPANLYVIGTMNTADRSIALLDIALRRRFEFKALYPEYAESEWWSTVLENLNLAIYNWKKNPDFFIGHAFFIGKSETDRTKILNTKIIPLLYEYCQNNSGVIIKILNDAGIQIKLGGIKENFQIMAE